MARPDTRNRYRYQRLEIVADASAQTTGQPVPTITINNLDSGGNIFSGDLATLGEAFRRLGYNVTFAHIEPAS